MRCLEDAGDAVEVDAREVDQPGDGDEELRSPYVDDSVLDLRAWARDALALALPTQIFCREDCPGLCAVCGAEPERGPRARPRARARPPLGQALRAQAGLTQRATGPLLASAAAMAVPKQRQSHSRTNKRRSQHKICAPALAVCPRCGAPRIPHRVCGECGTYAGREVVRQASRDRRRVAQPAP